MGKGQYKESKQIKIMEDGIIRWDNLRRVLGEIGNDLRNTYQDNLIRDGKLASGNLLNSVNYEVQSNGRSIWIQLQLADYWKWVEEGRQPGKFPPPEAIMDWIRIKPILPDARTGKLPTEEQLAFLIGRKIAEEGIEPGYQLRDAMQDNKVDMEDRIDEAISLDINASLDVIFSIFFN